ncbi:merozoite surface protein 4 [Plasmodium reichenowi]|uniref:Merozoite surface protein 4 n=1 Tax=Plasmodium reichenowi TaxID=5854 RepID=A0A060RN57_PLARE|nr:merozoite surface protein 4 [Plasmodium reichenowi]KYO02989.1 merozoite surface protein 4 [Plasmodium reichenowi]CDO62300.1 merozoite surface protein 4 [Plasmodium reichenowi]SOV75320.1 merozoite surface protein 4 [Plasmodium reichenowi]
MWIVKFLIVVHFFIICTIYFDKLYISYSYNIVPENGRMLNMRILEEEKPNVDGGSTSDTPGKNESSSVSPNLSSTEEKKDEKKTSEQGKESNKKENAEESANGKGDVKEEKPIEEKGGEQTDKVQEKVLEKPPKESQVVDERKKNEAIPKKVVQPSSSNPDGHVGEEEDHNEGEGEHEEEEDHEEDDDDEDDDTYNKEDLEDEDLCKHNNGDCGDDKLCEYVGNRRVKCKCKEGYKLEGIECVELFSLTSSSLNLIFNSFITIFVVILVIN